MQDIARLIMMITCLIAIAVGLRTLWIWRRTRKHAELAIGLNILSIALGGVILAALAGTAMNAESTIFYAIGFGWLVVHIAALYLGTWKIFRPNDRWPLALSAVAIVISAGWVASIFMAPDASNDRSIIFTITRLVGMIWSMSECLRYSAMLRRRARLGLADPMIAHRIWLWGMGAVAQVVVLLFEVVSWYTIGMALMGTTMGLYLVSMLGLVGTSAVALAFFPPASYVGFITRGYTQKAAEEAA